MGERRRYRAVVAYDGSAYSGFQRQARAVPTVQDALERAINRVTGEEAAVTGSGRTDTGVHARGQVISFEVGWKHSDDILLRAINAVLPDDIALQTLTQAAPGFHPRHDATSRVYRYTVVRADQRQPLEQRRAWVITEPTPLNIDAMQQAAGLLVGPHDFGAFGKPPSEGSTNTQREVMRSAWTDEGGETFVYTVEANAFLQHMVRRIVGALADVGRGWQTLDAFEAHFRGAALRPNWTIAPPQGLVLEQVNYPATAGEYDEVK